MFAGLKKVSVVCCTLFALALGGELQAAIVNGDFSTSGYVGWTTAGLVIPGANRTGFFDPGIAPLGAEIAVITSPDSFNGQAEGGASPATVEGLLGLSAGTINTLGTTPAFGAVISQSFTAAAGDKVRFQWNFLSFDETGYFFDETGGDFAFVYLSGPGIGSLLTKLADLSDLTSAPDGIEGIPGETGMATFTSPTLASGTYTLGLFVFNNNDNNNATSVLLVDNAELVPEPGSALLLATGALGLLIVARRRKV